MKKVLRRPSPAMVVAIVALIAALGGTAVAGGVLNKKKAKKIANSAITKRAPGLSVAHAKSADSAGSANTLTGLTKINYSADSGSADQQVFSAGGLALVAKCSGAAADLDATTSVAATLQSYGNTSDTNDTSFNPGDTDTLLESDEERDFVYTGSNGSIIVGQLAAAFNAGGLYGGTSPKCIIKGYVQVL
jgi:hypothetical protein